MPFTPSHVAAVLPFRRLGILPFAALAAGSMAPDLPYYVPGLGALNAWTHTLPGMVSVDVLLGAGIWALWRSAAGALHDLCPPTVRERWDPPGWTASAWWGVPVAIALGAATHVGWDDFTHAGRWATTHIAFLANSYPGPFGPLAGYRYAQYASGAVGLAIVALAAVRLPRTPGTTPEPDARAVRTIWWLCAAAAAAGAAARIIRAGGVHIGWDALAFTGLTGGLGAAAGVLLLACWARALTPRVVGWARAGGGAAGQ